MDKANASENGRPILLLPWVIGTLALAIYLVTLNHWVTFASLSNAAKLNGWNWHSSPLAWRFSSVTPLYDLFTFPLRGLPAAWKTIALNVFSALCAAMSLALLVRSVSLLPHDRTREQRTRPLGTHALLSFRESWLPPLLAALACGLQLTFWENATAGSTEMLDLLVFAWLIHCLLQFRVSKNNRWLEWFVFSYGLGVCDNWALIGFFPFFLVALIWIKGMTFLDGRFLGRLAILGLAGLSLYFLMPVLGMLADKDHGFWELLHAHLAQQKYLLLLVPRWIPLLLSLPTILALAFIGISWPSFSGDLSAFGSALSSAFFRFIHIAFLVLGLSYFFDYKFSPRTLLPQFSSLTFYYLASLSVGYFSGYILQVCGRPSLNLWPAPSRVGRVFDRTFAVLVWISLFAIPAGLLYKNAPGIRAANCDALERFATEMVKSLPETPSVVLTDDHFLLYLAQAAAQRLGKSFPHTFLETDSLTRREYLLFLRSRYPAFQKIIAKPEAVPEVIDSSSCLQILVNLSRQQPLFYLHPSFGYFFEQFRTKPHGLACMLIPSPDGPLNAPPISEQELKAGQDYWSRLAREALPELPYLARKTADSAALACYYSRALDDWGVRLQKNNRLKEAADQFSAALRLNSNNVAAQINQLYNARLSQGKPEALQLSDRLLKAIRQYPSWDALLSRDGPVDEPGANLQIADLLTQGNNPRQAAALFQRNLQLRPADIEAQIGLARSAGMLGLPDKTLQIVQQLRNSRAAANPRELSRLEALAYLQKNDFARAEAIFQSACQANPADPGPWEVLIDFYRSTGYAALRNGAPDLAKKRFQLAISNIDQLLQRPGSSSRAGSQSFETEALLKKAELQMQLAARDQAVATLGLVLNKHPNNAPALMNRAIAQLLDKKLDAAKRDYLALKKLLPSNTYALDYGLGEIAFQQNDKPAAIDNYTRYLKHAPKIAPEYKVVADRLRKLEAGS